MDLKIRATYTHGDEPDSYVELQSGEEVDDFLHKWRDKAQDAVDETGLVSVFDEDGQEYLLQVGIQFDKTGETTKNFGRCQSCGRVEMLKPSLDRSIYVEPGEVQPAGKCKCGGLIYPLNIPPAAEKPGIVELIAKDESDTLEFKSTARWNLKVNIQDKKIEHEVVQAVAGFLNSSKGGTLLIGIGDNGELVGLGHDYETLGNKGNRDGFQLWLNDKLLNEKTCGQDCTSHIEIAIEQIRGRDICRIEVSPSHRAVWISDQDRECFYLRRGNSTINMAPSKAAEYIRNRWR